MSQKIKGFTIELSLDHLKVDSGLKNVRRSISQMNGEMRANMSVFDRSERSMQKYGVQLQGLNKKLELQKQIVSQAKKDYDQMVATHGEGSKAAHDAAVAYNREVAQLNNLERHVKNVTKEMEAFKREQEIQSSLAWKAGDAFEKFGNDLDNLSAKARSVGGSLTKYLTLPITGLMATVGGMGFKRAMDIEQVEMMMEHISDDSAEYEKRMRNVVDLVTDTRFGTAELGAEYAKFIGASASDTSASIYSQVAMNLASFKSDDQLIPQIGDLFTKALQSGKIDGTMINQFTNAGVDIIKVLGNKWGMSTDQVKERLRSGSIDIHEVLDELSEGILEGTEGELGVTKAMGGMLEKSGRTLSGQIKNFFAAISQTGERVIKETGMFDGVKKSLDELREMLRSGELDKLLIPTFQMLAKAMEALIDIMRKVFKWFSSLDDSTKEWIGKLVGLAVVIGPIITGLGIFGGIIAKVSKGLGIFLKWIAPLTKGLGFVGKGAGGAGKSVGLLSRAFTLFTGPVGIAIGVISLLVGAFTLAYKKSETFRNMIKKVGSNLKETFSNIMDYIRPGIDAIKEFFGSLQDRFRDFMQNEGPQFKKALDNIKSVLSAIGQFLADRVVNEFEKFKIVIDFVMPYIADIVKKAWGNIKASFEFGLELVMGAIQIFSGIFTGDWAKVWEAFGNIGKAAMDLLWHYLKDTWIGKMITDITGFDGDFNMTISDMWKNVKKKFTDKTREIYNNLKNTFIGRIIFTIIEFSLNFRKNISEMWDRVKSNFTSKINEIRLSIANSFVGRIIQSVTGMKTRFIGIAKDMWTGVKKQFNNIVDGAKALPGLIGQGIRNARSKATNAMKSVGNKMIEWSGKPFNKVVDGVNWVTGKLGIKTKIAKWDYPQYAKGTKGHPGGPAVVGDKYGRELVQFPDGRSWLSPDTDTLVNLPKGTQVIPNRITEKLLRADVPHYAKGTGLWQGIKNVGSKAKAGIKKAWSTIGDVWEYASNPSKLVDKIIDNISLKSGMAEIPKSLVNAGWSYVKTKPYDYVKSMFTKAEEEGLGGGGKPAFGWPITSPFGYRTHPISGQRKLHGGVDFGAPMGTPIPSTTAGRVSYAAGGWNGGFGNLVKVRQGMMEYFYAHLSSILVKAGQSVSKGTILGRVGSTGASTGPHLHYEARRNGVRINPMTLKGFATGGIVKSPMMAMLGEEGEEVVIPTNPNRRTDAMKLLALAAKKIGADNGSFTRPNNIKSDNDSGDTKEMITLLLEQNEHLKKSNELLMALLGKDLDLYKLNKKVDEGLSNLGDRRNAALGIK